MSWTGRRGRGNMKAVQVIEGQVSLRRLDKVNKLPPSEDRS